MRLPWWSLLQFSPDPSLRSLIIHYLWKLGTDHNTLAARLEMETEVSIRRALIQSLGGMDSSRIRPVDRSRIAMHLQELYVHDPDSGIHGSASWALRKWKVALAELPVGEPVLTEEQETRLAKLTAEIEDIQQRIVESGQEIPARQAEFERQLREPAAALPDSLSEGLIFYCPLDEAEGKETANAVKGQLGGVYAGSDQPEWMPGVIGRAVRLTGQGEHFACGHDFSPERTDSFSYGCWFLADAKSNRGVLFGKFANANQQGFAVNIEPKSGDVICEWSHHYPENSLIVRANVEEIDGRWHHLLVTQDGSSRAAGVRVYFDGYSVPLGVELDRLSDSIQVSTPFQIGRRDTSYDFHGAIDEFRIYNRPLSEVEVQDLYASGLRALVGVPPETRTLEQQALLAAMFRKQDEPLQRLERQLSAEESALSDANNARWNGVRRWFVNRQGQTMVVTRIPAADNKKPIARHVAISSHEVTVADFFRFREKHWVDRKSAPTDDCPVNVVSWYDAAEYCNWLSQQEEIPEYQWAYQPNDRGRYEEGMKIREQSTELAGYRLPTKEEWEFACRSGTSGSYGFGEPVFLLQYYGWCAKDSAGRSYSVEALLPNDAGLFDLHGNVWEWTQTPFSGQSSPVNSSVNRLFTGGSYIDPSSILCSANLNGDLPTDRGVNIGFRLAKTLSPIPLTSARSTR